MKKSRFSEQQIAFILKQAEDGTTVEEVCRKAGISIQTYYRWRSKYGGLMPSEMKRLKVLEEENVRLKRLVANLSLDKEMLQDVIRGKCRADRAREIVGYLQASYQVSERRACGAFPINRSTQRYQFRRLDQAGLKMRIKELASTRVCYGYRRIHVLLRREGWEINHKRTLAWHRREHLHNPRSGQIRKPVRSASCARRASGVTQLEMPASSSTTRPSTRNRYQQPWRKW
jgi:putative transposase